MLSMIYFRVAGYLYPQSWGLTRNPERYSSRSFQATNCRVFSPDWPRARKLDRESGKLHTRQGGSWRCSSIGGSPGRYEARELSSGEERGSDARRSRASPLQRGLFLGFGGIPILFRSLLAFVQQDARGIR